MNQELRNALRRNVQALRETLTAAFARQLEGTFGVLPDGTVKEAAAVPPLRNDAELRRRRDEIVAALRHDLDRVVGKDAERRAVEMFVLESAFTLLNRLAALKLLERRDLVPECLSRGRESEGFRLFRQIAPEVARARRDDGYRFFLELLFDDVAAEIRLLFDRTLPPSHLFPEEPDLRRVLELLNDTAIADAWEEDETLGWVYQYFTPKELRERVRKESPSGPRNSHELAFLNQFYTPDYVVRFLAENTLGRLWWEMKPDTALKDREFFVLRPGEEPARREPKDPRHLRVLDPACGSGHFLHYCFDLLRDIYQEAYDDEDFTAAADLRREYADADGFARAVPGLILKHNLYGIDIDLRATQLTAVSLYLRAKRAHPEATIRRANAVFATAMPGDEALFREFLDSVASDVDGEILRVLLKRIQAQLDPLATEAGTLLKAETSIRAHIEDLYTRMEQQRREGRQLGLQELLGPEYEQGELSLDRLPAEAFWENVEERILDLLRRYAERAETDGVARRLLADDAAHGIGFLDALLRRYDVVLMNPPFGAASKPSKKYVDAAYPLTKNDVYAAFVERGLELLHDGGYLGAITSRTGFFLSSFQKWREEILLKKTGIVTFADLGYGVLDTAMVETAAYVLRRIA